MIFYKKTPSQKTEVGQLHHVRLANCRDCRSLQNHEYWKDYTHPFTVMCVCVCALQYFVTVWLYRLIEYNITAVQQ